MEYNDNIGGTSTTNSSIFVGDKYDLSEFESSVDSYWIDSVYCWKNKKMILAPQVAALFEYNKAALQEEHN